ncbi:hypothetical protein Hanom_Chr03g00263091 [Helianthus anomalus]
MKTSSGINLKEIYASFFFFERPTKSPGKHTGMPSIEQMHPLLHNGQSWMHTRATKPPVPGKTRRPKAHCGKTRFGSVSNWRPPERPSSKLYCHHQCPSK